MVFNQVAGKDSSTTDTDRCNLMQQPSPEVQHLQSQYVCYPCISLSDTDSFTLF